MQNFDKYKVHLCAIAKDPEFKSKKFASGFTSEVYRLGDSVIKEVFLNKETLEKGEIFNELEINVFLRENPELHPYVIRFEGYEICDDKLYMKFPYEGKNFSEIILDFSVPELYKIVKNVEETFTILHTKLVQVDSKVENIYVQRVKNDTNDFKILLSDWGNSSFDLARAPEDMKRFKRTLKERLLMVHLFKKCNTKYLLKLVEDKGLKKKFLYNVNKTMELRREMHHYRPAEFLEAQRPIFFSTLLFGMIMKEYGEEFVRKRAGITKDLSKFLDSIEVKKVVKSSPKKSIKELIKSTTKKTLKLSIKKVKKFPIKKTKN
jgi:hypothetical protein